MKLSVVLLAGGESRRMGRDKATILFRGQPLWRHQIHLLQSMGPFEILISARTDPPWRPAGTIFVADDLPSRGPLSGITAAMRLMRGTHLLAVAVDMPLIAATHLRSMWERATPDCGILPQRVRRAEPLAAIYPRTCLPHFAAALGTGNFSLQHVTQDLVRAGLLAVVDIPAEQHRFYESLNTESDVESLERSSGPHDGAIYSSAEPPEKANVYAAQQLIDR